MVYISLIFLQYGSITAALASHEKDREVTILKVGQQFTNSLPLLEKHLGMASQVISNVPELFLHLRKKLFIYFSSILYGYLGSQNIGFWIIPEEIFTKPHLFLVLLCELLLFLISFSPLLNRRIHLCLKVSSETRLHNGKTNLPWDSLCSDPILEGKRVQIPFLRKLNKNINSIQRAPHNGELGSSLSDSPANPFVDRHPLHSFSTRVHNLLQSELGSFLWK